MPDAGSPLATDTKQLDHLSYVEKLRHWMRDDAWNPAGNKLHMKNCEISRSAVRMDGGHIVRMPLLVGRPCFGIATASLAYRNRHRYVKRRGRLPVGRCHTCKSREACGSVVLNRLNAVPAIQAAWTLWLQHDGPNAFEQPNYSESHARRLWAALCRELSRHVFSSSNDEAVRLEYARIDQEKLKADRLRKEKDRLAARMKGVVDHDVLP